MAQQERINRQWRLSSRPSGTLGPENFAWHEEPVAPLAEGQILVRTVYLSLDPTNRTWASDAEGYLPPVAIGDVMRGGVLGVVEESRSRRFRKGDLVSGLMGWQSYPTLEGASPSANKVPKNLGVPLEANMAVLSHIGLTAYFGLFDIGRPKPGETILVSAAAGAVGSLVGQMGKIAGCRVVGTAGSDEKCRWITEDLGFDAAINYRTENVLDALRRHCPKGVDVFFDNVGGEMLEAGIELSNLHARIVICGQIAQYDKIGGNELMAGPRNHMLILTRRLHMEGLIVLDYLPRMMEAVPDLIAWLKDGRLKYRVDVVDGLENAPEAVGRLFDGRNIGKLMVKVSEPPVLPRGAPMMGPMLRIMQWLSRARARAHRDAPPMRVPR